MLERGICHEFRPDIEQISTFQPTNATFRQMQCMGQMSTPDSISSAQVPKALAQRLRRLHPRRVKELLDELGLEDPAEDVARDYNRYDVLTLAPLADEAECHLRRVEAVENKLGCEHC